MTLHRTVGRVVVALVAAAAWLALPATSAPAWAGEACPGDSGVTVVVDFHELGGPVTGGCVGNGGGMYAEDLFEAEGIDLDFATRQPGFVCRVQGKPASEPCVNTAPADAYWALWWSDGDTGSTWQYSSQGVKTLRVPDGGLVAFSWDERPGDSRPGYTAERPSAGQAPTSSPTSTPTSSAPSPTPSQPSTTAGSGNGSGGSGSGSGSGGGGTGTTSGSGSKGSGSGSGTTGSTSSGGSDGATGSATDDPTDDPRDATTDDPTDAADEPTADDGTDDATEDPTEGASDDADATDDATEGADGGTTDSGDPTTTELADPVQPTAAATDDDGGLPLWVAPVVVALLGLGAGATTWRRRRTGA